MTSFLSSGLVRICNISSWRPYRFGHIQCYCALPLTFLLLPEAIVTVFSAMTSLESFHLTRFQPCQSLPDKESQPLSSRTRFPFMLEDLHMRFPLLYWQSNDNEHTQWLKLLHPFTALKNLYLPKRFVLCIVRALTLSGKG